MTRFWRWIHRCGGTHFFHCWHSLGGWHYRTYGHGENLTLQLRMVCCHCEEEYYRSPSI